MIQHFAEQHRLTIRRDGCGDPIIVGKPHRKFKRLEDRCQIFEHSAGRLGLFLTLTARAWGFAKTGLLAAGFTLRDDGRSEGIFTFDPADPRQAEAAIREAGIRVRRDVSEAQRLAMLERLAVARSLESTTSIPVAETPI
jgi:hypothetical protein